MRYRANLRGLPGSPDIAFTRARLAIFVDGCFWHMCPLHSSIPKNNQEWWLRKLEANVERDRRKDRELEDLGWLAVHFWEHDDPIMIADAVEKLWMARVERPPRD